MSARSELSGTRDVLEVISKCSLLIYYSFYMICLFYLSTLFPSNSREKGERLRGGDRGGKEEGVEKREQEVGGGRGGPKGEILREKLYIYVYRKTQQQQICKEKRMSTGIKILRKVRDLDGIRIAF